jgi:Domain of unknown function (DUF4168)
MFRNLLTLKHFKQPVHQTKIRSIGFTSSHMTTRHTQNNFYRLSRSLMLGMMASFLSILGGIVPDFTAQQPDRIFASVARADDFSEQDLRHYGAALMQIEPIRQAALAQVSRANGGALPNLVCNQPSTMNGLNSEAKSLFINYCNQCESIAASQGLTIEKFNQITQAVRSNPQLKKRVIELMN